MAGPGWGVLLPEQRTASRSAEFLPAIVAENMRLVSEMTYRYVSGSRVAQRKPVACAPARPPMDAATDSVRRVVERGGGQPLDHEVRAVMEPALGVDLSTVRIHSD